MSSPKLVFSKASCPAFTMMTNDETGFRQIVQENSGSYADPDSIAAVKLPKQ